jgi:8-oxo-dGTP pyrophosphatase MutT (NUDIX family)
MSDDFEARLVRALEAHRPQEMTMPGARAAAVLIPIVLVPEPTLLFTVRTDTVRSHKGQISFPGGSVDETDDSRAATSVRETEEEIGLNPADVRLVGELDTFPTFVSGYVVTPFVGILDEEPELTPNPAEVARVLHVPVASLSNEIRQEPGFTHGERTYPTEAWVWEDHVIWGVTARIVRQFLEILGEAGLVEPPEGDGSWWVPPPPEAGPPA